MSSYRSSCQTKAGICETLAWMTHAKVAVAKVDCECPTCPAPDYSDLKEYIGPIPIHPSRLGVE